jgi:predicted protein tyrosine phosphatase
VFAPVAGIETRSAGTASDADNPLSRDDIQWADLIFAMERMHQRKIKERFSKALRGKRVVCMNITDEYDYMDAELVRLLWERVPRSVPGVPGLSAGRP